MRVRIVAVALALSAVACGQSQDILPNPSPTPCPLDEPNCHCDYHKICHVVYDAHGSIVSLKLSDELKQLAEDCGVKAVGYFGGSDLEKMRYELWIGKMLSGCWPWDAKYH